MFYEEPELAVHPVDQVSLAQLQYQLFRQGVKQVVATDSDYYLKALINEELAARLAGNEVSHQIIVYDCSAGKIRPCWQLFQEGVVDSFDDVTNAVNQRYYHCMISWMILSGTSGWYWLRGWEDQLRILLD